MRVHASIGRQTRALREAVQNLAEVPCFEWTPVHIGEDRIVGVSAGSFGEMLVDENRCYWRDEHLSSPATFAAGDRDAQFARVIVSKAGTRNIANTHPRVPGQDDPGAIPETFEGIAARVDDGAKLFVGRN